ncbi:MAG TPA: gephyrin-like molybdotransferase Glp [Verrucomicrobiae bacterium]|nr:gephyrin-like molybdotransferase Glp [Verrucomicrobiae bacterium]
MLAYEEALERILAALPPPKPERIALGHALARVLAERVDAPLDLPPFDNSAMDGYAVRAADLTAAGPGKPVRLPLAGRIAAGGTFQGELSPGTAVRVFTGSPVPLGADAVVMQEQTRALPSGEVEIAEPIESGENLRRRGEDIQQGAVLLEAGDVLTPGKLSLLAASGVAELVAGGQPIVGILATGSELKEPGEVLRPGQIYESNRFGLAAMTHRIGVAPMVSPLVRDDLEATRQALTQALDRCDVLVTSGGVSVGEMDFVREAFTALGGELQYWKVAIKPGRPFVFGQRRGKFLFGLPGNPVSALVTFQLLVRPALLRWQGATNVSLPEYHGVLGEALSNPDKRRHFMRVKVDAEGNVRSAGLQASHALRSLAAANGLLDLAPGETLAAGAKVRVLRWD